MGDNEKRVMEASMLVSVPSLSLQSNTSGSSHICAILHRYLPFSCKCRCFRRRLHLRNSLLPFTHPRKLRVLRQPPCHGLSLIRNESVPRYRGSTSTSPRGAGT